MTRAVRAARWVFGLAAAYGVVLLVPLYFAPPRGRPEFYFGFLGAALATQGLYYAIARAPKRFGGLIPIGIGSKLSFAAPCAWLFMHHRLERGVAVAAAIDALLAAAFIWCWWRLRREGMR